LPARPDAELDLIARLDLLELADETAIRDAVHVAFARIGAESLRLTPLMETMRFPSSMPALSAGPPAVTLCTRDRGCRACLRSWS
jgi:hypothetical protein